MKTCLRKTSLVFLLLSLLPFCLAQWQDVKPFAVDEDLLIYALAANYSLTPEGRPTVAGGLDHLPKISLAGGNLSLTFTPRKPGLDYIVQYTTDLHTWTDIPYTFDQLNVPHTVNSPHPLASTPRQHMRLKVVITNILSIDVDGDGLPDVLQKYWGSIMGMNINATTVFSNLHGLSALDAYLHGLNPKKSLAVQTAENYTYDARAWLKTINTPVLTATLTLDSEGNIESSQTTTTQ